MRRLGKKAVPKEVPAWKLAMEQAASLPDQPLPPLPPIRETSQAAGSGQDKVDSRSRSGSRSSSRSRSRSDLECPRAHKHDSRSRSRQRGSRSPSRSRDRTSPHEASGPSFSAAAVFNGTRVGFVFKRGSQGLGYYRDVGSAAAAAEATEEDFRRKLEAETGAVSSAAGGGGDYGGGDESDERDERDAPILAALVSHTSALDDAEASAAKLDKEVQSWGSVSRGARHAAEIIEVQLTDQLVQLTEMLDDCVSARGREAVKLRVSRLRGLGARLLKISQAGCGR